MSVYDRPPIYALTHLAAGFVAVWYPLLGLLAVLYQLTQYILNIRFFVFEGTYRQGNSLRHTGKKLVEMALGYALGYVVKHR